MPTVRPSAAARAIKLALRVIPEFINGDSQKQNISAFTRGRVSNSLKRELAGSTWSSTQAICASKLSDVTTFSDVIDH